MKFRIRYADKVVGIFIIVALLSLVFVIFLLGRTQRWFSRDYSYITYLTTASGINRNMPVIFRGINIGNVKSFRLTEDNQIEVIFVIHSEFNDRARQGSLVEMSVSPIGFGSRFIFHPGLGEALEEGDLVPLRGSPEGLALEVLRLTNTPPNDDPIAVLMAQAPVIVNDIETIIGKVDSIMDELNIALAGLNVAPGSRASTALGETIADVQRLTSDLAEGSTIRSLEASLASLAGTLDQVERTAIRDMPQIAGLIAEARSAILAADDVLVGLSNNPLLRGGIPDRAQTDTSGTNPRNIQF